MRTLSIISFFILVLASCSTPKYAYHFDHVDYYAGKPKSATSDESVRVSDIKPIDDITPQALVATIDEHPKPVVQPKSQGSKAPDKEAIMKEMAAAKEQYQAMSKEEKKAFKKEMRSKIKAQIKANKKLDKDQRTKAWDRDLKMAAIFGAIGFVFLLIGGSVFWAFGAIFFVIGVVFFVMWLSRQ